jgi:hypothetical protein
MPKNVAGEPQKSSVYFGEAFDRPASPYQCRASGLPVGSSLGRVLEAQICNQAARGIPAAVQMMLKWPQPQREKERKSEATMIVVERECPLCICTKAWERRQRIRSEVGGDDLVPKWMTKAERRIFDGVRELVRRGYAEDGVLFREFLGRMEADENTRADGTELGAIEAGLEGRSSGGGSLEGDAGAGAEGSES